MGVNGPRYRGHYWYRNFCIGRQSCARCSRAEGRRGAGHGRIYSTGLPGSCRGACDAVPMPDQSSRLDPKARWRSPSVEKRHELVICSLPEVVYFRQVCGGSRRKSILKCNLFSSEKTFFKKKGPLAQPLSRLCLMRALRRAARRTSWPKAPPRPRPQGPDRAAFRPYGPPYRPRQAQDRDRSLSGTCRHLAGNGDTRTRE